MPIIRALINKLYQLSLTYDLSNALKSSILTPTAP